MTNRTHERMQRHVTDTASDADDLAVADLHAAASPAGCKGATRTGIVAGRGDSSVNLEFELQHSIGEICTRVIVKATLHMSCKLQTLFGSGVQCTVPPDQMPFFLLEILFITIFLAASPSRATKCSSLQKQ